MKCSFSRSLTNPDFDSRTVAWRTTRTTSTEIVLLSSWENNRPGSDKTPRTQRNRGLNMVANARSGRNLTTPAGGTECLHRAGPEQQIGAERRQRIRMESTSPASKQVREK